MKNLSKTYNPKDFEEKIYRVWEEGGYFRPEGKDGKLDDSKKPFTIVMPPPNVTGNLHLGHAMNNTIQDILIRHKRMQGYEALWIPGTDHASISTEGKVTQKLESQGKDKFEMGREAFLEEAWAWTEEYGGNIKNQLKRLGVSCDWSRERFTLDEGLSKAVEHVFIKMFDQGLIYRGSRIVNWCPTCGTAISDIEVDHKDEKGKLWYIKYPFKDSDDYITIATTRPETMLGDLAVAINKEDKRYNDKIGQMLVLPLVNREIPLIEDDYVDMEYGTGAVKITPNHDPNDFEVGQRHNLGECEAIDTEGKISPGYGKYSGLDRYEARKEILKDLEELGLLVKIEEIEHAVGYCSRCDTVIEPLLSLQWFVSMKELAKPAIEAVENGDVELVPKRFEKIYFNWLENIKDWNISRQLWWGHRIPIYYCKECKKVYAGHEAPDTCDVCGSSDFEQDPDTLDTWFSSALWPFSTLGWPEETEDFKKFFPTDVLVTGYDIIFFWVIRMIFSSLYNTGKSPFHHVLFTGLVLDENGVKMSKSLGNGIDPIEVIDEYGADALRFTLVTGTTPGNDSRFIEENVRANRNFANKLWNASRFVLMNVDEDKEYSFDLEKVETEDKWIISRLNKLVKDANKKLDNYEVGLAATNIYSFIWNEFCDWYIEFSKNRLYGQDQERKDIAISTLLYVLDKVLKLLHPFMPYITEEIFSYLPTKKDKLLIEESYPQYDEKLDFSKEEMQISTIIEVITEVRNQRRELELPNKKKNDLIVYSADQSIRSTISELSYNIKSLANTENITVINKDDDLDDAVVLVLDNLKLYIPLEGLVNYEKELERLEKEKKEIIGELKRAEGMLSNESFVSNAPEKLVAGEKEKKEKYSKMLEEIENSISDIKEKI